MPGDGDRIKDLLARWDKDVAPIDAHWRELNAQAEKDGNYSRADEVWYDRNELMSRYGEEAIDLLRGVVQP